MFALARRRLRDGAARLRRCHCRRGGVGCSEISTGSDGERGAQQRRRSQEAAARVSFAPFCTLRQISHWTHNPTGIVDLIPFVRAIQLKTGAQSSDQALFPAQHLDLPHPKQFDSRSSPRRDNAADANPSIFERLRSNVGAFERRYDAP